MDEDVFINLFILKKIIISYKTFYYFQKLKFNFNNDYIYICKLSRCKIVNDECS